MSVKKSNLYLIAIITCIAALYALLSVLLNEPAVNPSKEEPAPQAEGSPAIHQEKAPETVLVEEYFLSAGRIVANMLKNGSKMEELDFTLPEHPGYNTSDRFSIFQNKDPVQGGGLLPSPASLDPASFGDKFSYAFTGANKIVAMGTDAPEILFIAWPLKEAVCRDTNQAAGLGKDWAETHMLNRPPDLTPYYLGGGPNQATNVINFSSQNVPAANTPSVTAACAQDLSGVRYYIGVLVER